MDAGKSRHRVRASNQFHEDLELELADARTLCVPSMAAEGPEPD
jgi:hypothetical protein